MPQSFHESLYRSKLLFGAAFFFASAHAQINFFPATEEACNEFNFPCQGGTLCCPRPALCIPYFNELVCLDIGGTSVDAGTAGVDVNGLLGDILGGDATSLPSIISGGEVGPVVLPTIPSDGGEIAFTPSISGGGVGPIVIPTLIDGGGITFTPSFPVGEITPIVIPTPPPLRSGGDDGALAGGQKITPLPPLSTTTTKSLVTSTPPILSSTIPTDGRTSSDDNGFVTSLVPSSPISISILPSFTSVANGEGGGEATGEETTGGDTAGGQIVGGKTGGGEPGKNTGGETGGGETEGGATGGGESGGGEIAGGETASGETAGSQSEKTGDGENGKTSGGETATPTDGGSTNLRSTSGPGSTATVTESSSFTGAASPRSVRDLSLWGNDIGFVIALGVTIAGMGVIMVG